MKLELDFYHHKSERFFSTEERANTGQLLDNWGNFYIPLVFTFCPRFLFLENWQLTGFEEMGEVVSLTSHFNSLHSL